MGHVTFVHGILNKTAPEELIQLWRRGLAEEDGFNLGARGVTCSMVYWADVLYDKPLVESAHAESLEAAAEAGEVDPLSMEWRAQLRGKERDLVEGMARDLGYDEVEEEDPPPPGPQTGPSLERVPLPGFLKKRIMGYLLRDVHHYLYNVDFSPRGGARYRVQEEIRKRFVAAIEEGSGRPGPHVVMSHSMGTVIAYDCLKRVTSCPRVDALMTIGSPLGLDEIQDALQPEWSRLDGFPSDRVAKRWVNVYDGLDPVAGFDGNLANDFLKGGLPSVEDIHEPNWGKWRHDISKYLRGARLRERIQFLLS
jgi:hypothetical protein